MNSKVNFGNSKTSNRSKDRVLYKAGMKSKLCEVIQRSGIMIGGARNLLKRSSIQRTEYKRRIFMMKKTNVGFEHYDQDKDQHVDV